MFPKLRWTIASNLKKYPGIYLPLVAPFKRDFEGKRKVVSAETELLIEAPPRSGNTFAKFAFELAQEREICMAHHLHAAANVIAAVKRDIPSIVLIRNPRDTVLSQMVYAASTRPHMALKDYVRFYNQIRPYRKGFVLAKFETVTQDFGLVIANVNQRFGTNFKLFDHTEENEQLVFERVSLSLKQKEKSGKPVGQMAAMPVEGRQSAKEKHASTLDAAENGALLDEASRIYEEMAQDADL